MRVVVTATNDEGSQSATSDPSDVVAAVAPGNTAPPSATGSAADEQVLTADDGDWTGTGPFDVDYQWQRCDSDGDHCDDIPGATGPTYELGDDDTGHTVVVVVTATNPQGAQTVTSAPSDVVAAVAPTNDAGPSIAGSQQAGETLTADEGDWSGTGPFERRLSVAALRRRWATTAWTSRARPAPPTSSPPTTSAAPWSSW